MLKSIRSYREWLGRWFSTAPERIDIDDHLAPVIIVDDVRELSVPVLIPYYSRFHGMSAVVGEYSVFELRATTRPLEVVRFASVNAANIHPFVSHASGGGLGILATLIDPLEVAPYRFDGAYTPQTAALYEGSATAVELDGQLSENGAWFGSTAGRHPAQTWQDPPAPVLLMPGESFYIVGSTENLAVSYSLWWREFPSPALGQLATSRSRA